MNNLETFRKKIKISSKIENKSISKILVWLKKRNIKNKMEVQKIPVANLKDWFVKKMEILFINPLNFFQLKV